MPRALWNPLGIAAVAATLAFGAPQADAEWVDWIATADSDFEYTDNLNNSAFDADEEDGFGWLSSVEGGRVYQLTDHTRVSLSATLAGELYTRWDELSAVEGGGRLSLFHKFGLGDAPWLRPFFWGGYKDVSADERSGARFDVGLDVGKRFTPRLDAIFTYQYTNRDGGSGPVAVPTISNEVFDQQYHQFTLASNVLLLEPLLLTTSYTFRLGDFDSACTPGNVGTVLAKADVKAIALDSVFGGCVYRLNGTGHAALVNLSWGVNDHFSIDLGYRYQYGKAQGLDYSSNTGRLTLLIRY
jgi:opacity protein-like surface antigen